MSFFEDASLVLIPSAQKTSKVYSVKPTDGTGDLTFTRSNDTATRVGPDGLIEKVRTNLVRHSEDFTNAAWTKYQTSATGNSTTAPNGTTTADTLTENTVNDIHVAFQSNTVVAGELTVSCYAKANTKNHAWLQIYDGSTFQNSGIFNLTAGTVSGAGTITNEGNGWYRISFTATVVAGSTTSYIGLSDGTNVSYTGTSQSIFIWGYQTEQGVKTDYIATTTAAVSVGPVANVPRLDYLGSSCPRLLLEPQRTNLALLSEQFNNSAWVKEPNNTVTQNTITSPDGYVNADTLTATSGSTINIYQSFTSTSNSTQTFSVFLKKGNLSEIQIYIFSSGFVSRATINLDNGTITNVDGSGATITNYGNGWYRCSINGVVSSGVGFTIGILSISTTGTRNVYAYGGQFEVGAYATSYIPTLGSASTRGSDAASKTGISSLIGQTEGTLFAEFDFDSATFPKMIMFVTTAGSFGNAIYIQTFQADGISFQVWNGVVNQVSINVTGFTNGQRIKVAMAYKANDFAVYVNGVQRGTDTSGTLPAALNNVEIGTYLEGGSPFSYAQAISQALLFTTRLTNAQLAELTTI